MAKWMGIEVPLNVMVAMAIAIGLGLVLLVSLQTPSTSESGSRNSPLSARRRDKSKGTEKEAQAPASDAAKEVAKRLGVSVSVSVGSGRARRRVPITVCVNHVVLRRSQDGEWEAIDSSIKALALLNEVASVFLVARVETDLEESLVKDVAISSGLISPLPPPSTSSTSPPSTSSKAGKLVSTKLSASALHAASTAETGTGIPEHRLLFCSSHIGQVAVVQQLAPSLHIGGPIALLEGICRFVPSLVRIDPSAVALPPDAHDDDTAMSAATQASDNKQASHSSISSSGSSSNRSNGRDGGYKLEWSEYTSLAAAAGLPTVAVGVGTAEDESKGNDENSGVGEGNGTVEPLTSNPGAEGAETRQTRPLGVGVDVDTVSGGGSGLAGVETVPEPELETDTETTVVDFTAISQVTMDVGGDG